MSKDYHHGQKKRESTGFKRRKRQPNWETARIPHEITKQQREDLLRHAVTHGDRDALEDYDEPDIEYGRY